MRWISRGKSYLPACVCVLVMVVYRSGRKSWDGGRVVDSENVLTFVFDAHTGDKGSSPDSSTTKSESSFKMVA